MVVVCQIFIDKPSDGVHRAGGIVSGVVKYAMDQPTEFRDIILSLRGESWCSWSASKYWMTTTHLGIDKHLIIEERLLKPIDKTQTLPAGPYEHSFHFILPKDIPPSFSTPTGNVSYRILLEIKRQNMYNIITRFVEAEILVHNYLGPLIRDIPMTYCVTKKLPKSLSLGKLKMSLKAEIPSPYVKSGEQAELKLEITNQSIVKIKCITAELISTTLCTANCGSIMTETQKVKDCVTEIAKIPSCYTTTVNMSVPILDEHQSVQYSKIISNQYKILVTVRLPLPYRNISTFVPIFIR